MCIRDRADADIRTLIEKTGIPYLPMSMAKGILPDTHEQSAAAARSYVPVSYTHLDVYKRQADQTAVYVDMLKKIRETPEWKDYMEKGAFNQTFMTGADFSKWLDGAAVSYTHLDVYKRQGV